MFEVAARGGGMGRFVRAWHGTVEGGIGSFRTDGAVRHQSAVGAWFSECPRVAEFFARLRGEAPRREALPMWLYEVEVDLAGARRFDGYRAFQMDLALNPLRDDAVFTTWEEWEARSHHYGDRPDDDAAGRRPVAAYREHLLSLGVRALVVDGCMSDVPVRRRDFVALDPGVVRVLGRRPLPPLPEGPYDDPRDLALALRDLHLADQAPADAANPAPR